MRRPLSLKRYRSKGVREKGRAVPRRAGGTIYRSEELFRLVFNSSCDAILLHTADGAVFEANDTFLSMYGARPEQVPLINIQTISSPTMSMVRARDLWDRVLAGIPQTFEWKARRLDNGAEFDVEVFLRKIHLRGKDTILANVRDLTVRKQAEAALQAVREQLARSNADLELKVQERTARLQETVEELQHFSYTLTHDMRAPLRAMQGLGGLLVQECADCKEASRHEYIRRITEAAARMDQLITDALQYGEILQDRFPLEPVDADRLLRGMIETYPDFHPRQADIEVKNRLPVVLGNAAALTQCFSNLLSNAIKFARPGQRPRVRIWSEPREGWIRLWFEDDGIGIPAQYHEKIWVMFQKLDKNTPGTGIGLPLVRKAVARMGGTVGVESAPGQGARFWVELASSAAPSSAQNATG